jgi:YVTN family beta-propeller protein
MRHLRRPRPMLPFALAVVLAAAAFWVAHAQTASEAGRAVRTHPPSPTPTDAAPPTSSARPSVPARPRGRNVYAAIRSRTLSPKVSGARPLVYVPNGVPGTVEEIDPTTFKVVRRLSFGYRSFPEHVTPSWNMRRLYVDVDGASRLAVLDPKTGRLLHVIHGVDHPYNLYFTPDGSRAIDVAEYENRLNFMDPRTWRVAKSLPMPCSGADHMDFGPPGTTYLLVSCEYDGQVIKVDWHAMRVRGAVYVGGLPVDVKLTPDGRRFLVGNQGSGGVSVVDPTTMKVTGFIHTGAGAHGMAVSRNTKDLYLSNRLAGTISVIDFASLRVVATWHPGGSPDMLQVSPDGTQLWVSNRYGTTVTVLSTTSGHVLHQIEVGRDPHGLAYFPQPGRFSLGHNGVYR